MTETGEQTENEAVLAAHAENRAIATLMRQLPGVIQNANDAHGELSLTIVRENIVAACRALQAAGYNFLVGVTCVDWYPNQPRFQVVYHLLSHALKQRLRLCVLVAEDDLSVDSIVSVWPAANFYEREVFDLFGVRFAGHPNLRRLLMPEEFQYNPLRKDFPVEGYR